MRGPGESEDKGGGGAFPPLVVFLVLMAVLLAVGGVVLFTNDDPPPEPTPTQSTSPDFSLTDAEAIARFKELRELRDQMYRHRDLSLVPLIYTADGPSSKVALNELRRLTRDEVSDRSTYQTHAITVEENAPERVRLMERITFFPRFIASDGENVTRDPAPLRQLTTWVLVENNGQWLVHESRLEQSRRVDA